MNKEECMSAGCSRFDVVCDTKTAEGNKFAFYEVYDNDGEAVAAHKVRRRYTRARAVSS